MVHPVSFLGMLRASNGFYKAPSLKAGCQDQRLDGNTLITLSYCHTRKGYIVCARNVKTYVEEYWLAFTDLFQAREAYCLTPARVTAWIKAGAYKANIKMPVAA